MFICILYFAHFLHIYPTIGQIRKESQLILLLSCSVLLTRPSTLGSSRNAFEWLLTENVIQSKKFKKNFDACRSWLFRSDQFKSSEPCSSWKLSQSLWNMKYIMLSRMSLECVQDMYAFAYNSILTAYFLVVSFRNAHHGEFNILGWTKSGNFITIINYQWWAIVIHAFLCT